MKYIIIAFLFVSCAQNKKQVERYFYITYHTTSVDGDHTEIGDIRFSHSGFPSLQHIDSMVYDGLAKRRECYQPVIITYLFEFKSKEDFDCFIKNDTGTIHFGQPKSDCCGICPDSISLGQLFHLQGISGH